MTAFVVELLADVDLELATTLSLVKALVDWNVEPHDWWLLSALDLEGATLTLILSIHILNNR